MSTLDAIGLVADPKTKIVLCCGSGGVGKTTISATLALSAARSGRRVVVLTVDPAKRLAQALGLDNFAHEAQGVVLPEGSGTLDAMMLDVGGTFDDMVRAAASPADAQTLLENRFYLDGIRNFSGTSEYVAIEKVAQLLEADRWDLIVVDTPPARNALDFLDAPGRFSALIESRLMGLLGSNKKRGFGAVMSTGTSLALKAISMVVGKTVLNETREFVVQANAVFDGFGARADATLLRLREAGAAFLVVSAPEPGPLGEAGRFVDRLNSDGFPLAGLVINRTHPRLAKPAVGEGAQTLPAGGLAHAVMEIHRYRGELAGAEVAAISTFAQSHPDVARVGVPALPFDVSDLDGLAAIAEQL